MQKQFLIIKKLMKKNDIRATYILAVLYDFEADQSLQDINKAIYYYQKAAKYGHAGALNNLAVCYEHGQGVKKDAQKAFQLYQKAAEKKDVNATMNIAKCYLYGRGCEVDLQLANEWCLKAIGLGYKDGEKYLKQIKEKQKKKHFFSRFKK